MAGIGEAIALARIGGNLLAIPKTMQQQAQAQDSLRALLMATPGLADKVDTLAPKQSGFPGMNVPGLGQLLGGIWTLGQVLLAAGGGELPQAPRLPLGTYVQLQNLQLSQQKQQAGQRAAATYTNPRAKALAEAEQFGAAESVETGKLGPSGELQQLMQLHIDSGEDLPTARRNALADIDARRLARAKATAGVQTGAQLQRGQQEFTSDKPWMNRFGFGTQPQSGAAMPPSGPQLISGMPSTSPGLQAAVYRMDAAGGLQPVGAPLVGSGQTPKAGRLQLPGGSSVEFENPTMANEFATMMRAQGVDPLTGSPEDAQRVLSAWQDYQRQRDTAKEEVDRTAGRIPDTDRNALVALRMFQRHVHRALTEFSPDERARFTGYFNFPARRIAQFAIQDPRFAQWSALVGQVAAAKFGEGGKQLTPLEQQVVEQYIPTGQEWGGQVDFDAKGAEFLQRVDGLIRDRLLFATTGGGELRQQYEQERGQFQAPAGIQVPHGWQVEVK